MARRSRSAVLRYPAKPIPRPSPGSCWVCSGIRRTDETSSEPTGQIIEMPTLPTDALAAAQFLFRHLYRPIELRSGETLFAVAETEHAAEGDDWLWTDDNAKVLEFVSRPEIWGRFPRESAEMLRFVQAMCRGPFIFRRVSPHRLERVDGEGAVGRFVHSLMHVRSELPRGAVMAGMRVHYGRTAGHFVLG